MRDVDDRHALRLEVADDAEQDLDLGALSAEVGSSMIRMRALRDRALAISTICCWPIIRSSTIARGSTPVCEALDQRLGLALLLLVIDAPDAQ